MPIITPPPLQEPFDKEGGVSNPWKQWSQSVYTVANTVEQSGITANRPSHKFIGQQFFDTTLGKPVFSNGTAWVTISGSGGGGGSGGELDMGDRLTGTSFFDGGNRV